MWSHRRRGILRVPPSCRIRTPTLGPATIGETGFTVTSALGNVAILAVATRKYRGTDRVARRQMKWAVFGAYCSFLPVVAAAVLYNIDSRFSWLFFPSFWAVSLFPLFLVVSVAHDHHGLISKVSLYGFNAKIF